MQTYWQWVNRSWTTKRSQCLGEYQAICNGWGKTATEEQAVWLPVLRMASRPKSSHSLSHQTEALFFCIVMQDNSGLPLCVLYHPPWRGCFPFNFLMKELDNLLCCHQCWTVLIIGDPNFHLEQQAFNNLVTIQGLVNHITFPTHERGRLLDPVL